MTYTTSFGISNIRYNQWIRRITWEDAERGLRVILRRLPNGHIAVLVGKALVR